MSPELRYVRWNEAPSAFGTNSCKEEATRVRREENANLQGTIKKCVTAANNCKQANLSGNARYFKGDAAPLLSRKLVTSQLYTLGLRGTWVYITPGFGHLWDYVTCGGIPRTPPSLTWQHVRFARRVDAQWSRNVSFLRTLCTLATALLLCAGIDTQIHTERREKKQGGTAEWFDTPPVSLRFADRFVHLT